MLLIWHPTPKTPASSVAVDVDDDVESVDAVTTMKAIFVWESITWPIAMEQLGTLQVHS